MYNDDFAEINEIIETSLTIDKAGLILLHGAPGTGKTSYIKNLIRKHDKKNFIFIQNEFINELLRLDVAQAICFWKKTGIRKIEKKPTFTTLFP